MNNDIWKFHDWLIDQKNDNKVNENDFNFIIDHIRNNYCPNLENVYVQENLIESIEKACQERDWIDKNFWSCFSDQNNGLPFSIYYKESAKLLLFLEQIEMLSTDFDSNEIKYLQNSLNCNFTDLVHSINTGIYFTHLTDGDDFLIVLYNYDDEWMIIFDNSFNCYGYFDDHKSAVKLIKKFNKNGISIFKGGRLNNVQNYYNYLNSISDSLNIT